MNPSIEIKDVNPIEVEVNDINYIPSYKIAEQQRQSNELQRMANEIDRENNETQRETYYEDFKNKVDSGYFKGDKGDTGDKGDKGEDGTLTFEELTEEQKVTLKGDKGDTGADGKDGYTPVLGVDYWTEADKTEMQNYCNSYIDSQLGTINEQLASLTEVE